MPASGTALIAALAISASCMAGEPRVQDLLAVDGLPPGKIVSLGPNSYGLHLGGGFLLDLDPTAHALMDDFCRKQDKTVKVTYAAFDGGVGLRYIFSCVEPGTELR